MVRFSAGRRCPPILGRRLRAYPASRSLLLTKDGNPLPVGTLLRNPDLAKTYRLLARYGPSYLYDGPLARPSSKPMIIP